MTDEQKTQLNALETKSIVTKEDATALSQVNLAAENVGGETHSNSGYVEQFLNTTFDQFNMYTPLVMDFMRNPAQLMTQPKISADYYLITSLVDGDVSPGDQPDTVGTTTRKVTIGFGKLWLKDELLKEDLIARINQTTQLGKTLASDGSSANPINLSRKKLLSLIIRNFEKKAWNGDVNANGFGIVGIKTQHTKLNATTTVNGSNNNVSTFGVDVDGRYNKVNYTNDAAGKDAFATDVYGRIKSLNEQYGANHFTLYVPTGSGARVRQAFADFEKISLIVQQLLVNNNGSNDAGTKTGIFTNNEGRSYVNPLLDIKELSGLSSFEAYLYPDTVFGEWTYSYFEYGLSGKPLPGIRTIVSGLNKDLADITGINPDEVTQMWLNDSRAEVLALSLQWTGQIVAQAVGMATLYSRVQFITSTADIDVTDKTTGQIDLSRIS